MKVFTEEHLKAARMAPRKHLRLWSAHRSPEGQKYARAAKKERKTIARYWQLLRKNAGAAAARRLHRWAVVTNGREAAARIKELT